MIALHINKIESICAEKIKDLRRQEDTVIRKVRERYDETIGEVRNNEREVERMLKKEQARLETLESELSSTPEYLYDRVYTPYTDSYETGSKRNPYYDALYEKVEQAKRNVDRLKRRLDAVGDIISSLNQKMQDEMDNIRHTYSSKVKTDRACER